MQLTEKNLFKMLASLVSSEDSSPPLKTTSVFLTTCILLDNSEYYHTSLMTLYSASLVTVHQFKVSIWQGRLQSLDWNSGGME